MEIQELNLQLVEILDEWDPFGCGSGAYDPEIADVIYAVHEIELVRDLAIKVQAIYEHSFEEFIPYDRCLLLAKRLQALKVQASCR